MKKKNGKSSHSSAPVAAIVLAVAFVVTAVYCVVLRGQLMSPAVAQADGCAVGYDRYDMEAVDFSFCHPTEYGAVTEAETGISPEARKGTQYNVKFAESGTVITVETADFAKLGDSDVAPVLPGGFACLAAAANDIAREACFNEIDEVVDLESARDTAGRLRVGVDLKMQQIEGEKVSASYVFVPDVLQDGRYNMSISLSEDSVGQIAF